MKAEDLIEIFHDTQTYIMESAALQEQLRKSQAMSQLYLEGYTSPLRKIKGNGDVVVLETTTFQCAREVGKSGGRIAVLNFANPHEPGGGVLRGAMAQEECLCRCSILYNVLNQPYFQENYYRYHYQNHDWCFSDRVIYAPDVLVIKSDDEVPELLEKPFAVDVITCAAPFLISEKWKSEEELLAIYQSRIRNIIETAMNHDVDTLILGAFGCGAFRNDPKLMAQAFYTVLVEEQYVKYFEKIIFAIKRSEAICENLNAFQERF